MNKIESESFALSQELVPPNVTTNTQIVWPRTPFARQIIIIIIMLVLCIVTHKLSRATILKLIPYKLAGLSNCKNGLVTGGRT